MFDLKGRRRTQEIRKVLAMVPDLPDRDRKNILMFLEHGEWGLAFDSLCCQIYENEITISRDFYRSIESIGLKMGLEDSNRSFLKELVV